MILNFFNENLYGSIFLIKVVLANRNSINTNKN